MSSDLMSNTNLVHDVLSFILGIIAGVGGSFLTLKSSRSNRADKGSSIVDQSQARAGGDNVAGSKSTTTTNRTS